MISENRNSEILFWFLMPIVTVWLHFYFALEEEKMVRSKERVNKAQDRALENLDYVMDCYEATDFVEVTGRMGGDVITYRVFDDDRMYEK